MKLKKYGFTLVEMLSVIALLAALALIVIPNIDKLLKNSKTELYTNQVNLIKTGAKLWATDEENQKMLSENAVWPYVITLYDLQYGKFIDSDIVNPKTDQKFSENMLIYINKVDSKYVYTIDEESNDPLAPTIVITGDKVISLEIGSSYTDIGATATKPDGSSLSVTTSIKKNGTVSTIDTTKKGTYIITYSATYTESSVEHKATIARILKIVDTTVPVITCAACGSGTIELESTDSYTLPTVTVTDNSGETIKAILMGSFTTKIPGNKVVKYVATDSSGNSAVYTLNFNIKDTVSPTVTYATKINGSSITYEVIAVDNGSGVKEYSFDGGSTWQKSNVRSIKCNTPTTIVVKDNAGNKASKEVSAACQNVWSYSYNGTYQTFTAPYSGWYQMEAWGAESGTGFGSTQVGGKGAYTSGKIYLSEGTQIYIYVGSQGDVINSRVISNGGYNGGGTGALSSDGDDSSGGGGGATDFRLVSGLWNDDASLKSRIMVAAGAGGGHSSSTYSYSEASNGGTLAITGNVATWTSYFAPIVNQTSGGAFGVGSVGIVAAHAGAGGGGGYYGGYSQVIDSYAGRAAGGSSFISGYAGVNAITSNSSLTPTNNTLHYSGLYFIDGNMASGINSGNGKAVITYVSENKPERINLGLNNVRYIKDCTTGNEVYTQNAYWIEIQAIRNGINVAYNKTVTGSNALNTYHSLTYSVVTNGVVSTNRYEIACSTEVPTSKCVTIDLGQAYDLDELAVWHTFGYTYNNNTTSVSSDNINWVTVIANTSLETDVGKRVNAYTYPKYEYAYAGNYQTFTAPISGYYNIELFGAQGGSNVGMEGTMAGNYGGKGSYTKGKIYLNKDESMYIYVGGAGSYMTSQSNVAGKGYNGGGMGGYEPGCGTTCMKGAGGGGGATDIRLVTGNLNSRIMVASGGGGAANWITPKVGGFGGTLVGESGKEYNASTYSYTNSTGGTQIAGGAGAIGSATGGSGTFGIGGDSTIIYGGGGGGGYYGGGGGAVNSSVVGSGAGGSSFISGYAGVNAITSSSSTVATNNTLHYSNKYFIDSEIKENINSGNGRAIITYTTNSDSLARVNTKLNSVRYVKDCVNGTALTGSSHWVELQAIKNGVNLAKGKNVNGTFTENASYPYSRITDGDITSSNYTDSYAAGLQCVTVDLGQIYDLDEVAVWHYWADSRIYKSNVTYVSNDNVNWSVVISNSDAETSNGKRANAYNTNKIETTNVKTYSYNGSPETFTAQYDGWYKVELWGAQGGIASSYTSGPAAYTSGKINLKKGEVLTVHVGGAGISNCTTNLCTGGYNGGGNGGGDASGAIYQGSGGGATDIRYGGQSFNDRIMVAGGSGGGSQYSTNWYGNGGSGGTLKGLDSSYGGSSGNAAYPGLGGTQITGGIGANCVAGTFGLGGTRTFSLAGGGGGYYGGGCGWGAGGGGGSSFISGYAGVNAITSNSSLTPTNNTLHYSGKYFIDGRMSQSTNTGNGKAQITYLSSDNSSVTKTNTKLNNVRYIKDCLNGSSLGASDISWVELQAIVNGINVAKGKTVTGTIAQNASYPYSRITDGDITSANYAAPSVSGLQCVTVDLGQAYDLNEVAVWHYWLDGRTYYSNTTSVSIDNTNWTSVISNNDAETANGKRVNAFNNDSLTPGQNTYFSYTGGVQTFVPNVSGWYNVELWGAQSGNTSTSYGAYTSGKLYMTQGETYYVYVGGQGNGGCVTGAGGGYNGGGNSGSSGCSRGGGGATDVRLVGGAWNDATGLNSRIMVAGGGGAGENNVGGYGGTLIGGINNASTYATQVSGSAFGYATTPSFDSSGAGGGYYGGNLATADGVAAGGGSSFISGYAGVNAITSSSSLTPTNNTLHYSGKYFYAGKMVAGTNAGNGKANIKLITTSSTLPRIVPYLNNVRYVKDCLNGSTANTGNHWVELQAIVNGINVALGKTVTGTGTLVNPTYIVNGDATAPGNYTEIAGGSLQCVTVDLGASYNLDEIAIWHYYADSRTYYSNITYVSSDNSTFTPVIYKQEAETPVGKRVNAFEN